MEIFLATKNIQRHYHEPVDYHSATTQTEPKIYAIPCSQVVF